MNVLNLSGRHVYVILPLRRAMTLGNSQENFDVHQFLSSTLGELPPMPNPIVMAGEEKTPFKSVRHSHLSK